MKVFDMKKIVIVNLGFRLDLDHYSVNPDPKHKVAKGQFLVSD
jgi:hypothetical protein